MDTKSTVAKFREFAGCAQQANKLARKARLLEQAGSPDVELWRKALQAASRASRSAHIAASSAGMRVAELEGVTLGRPRNEDVD